MQLESRFVSIGEKDFEIEHLVTRGDTLLVHGRDFHFWGVRQKDTGALKREAIPAEVLAKLK